MKTIDRKKDSYKHKTSTIYTEKTLCSKVRIYIAVKSKRERGNTHTLCGCGCVQVWLLVFVYIVCVYMLRLCFNWKNLISECAGSMLLLLVLLLLLGFFYFFLKNIFAVPLSFTPSVFFSSVIQVYHWRRTAKKITITTNLTACARVLGVSFFTSFSLSLFLPFCTRTIVGNPNG